MGTHRRRRRRGRSKLRLPGLRARTSLLVSLALLGAVIAPGAAAAAAVTAVVGATVLHPELEGSGSIAPDSTILIAGNRITAVGPAARTRVPRGAVVIDAHGKWVIPGLIDSHAHFFQSGDLYTRPDVIDLGALVPYADEVRRNQARLPQTFRVYLASGVTSTADVGGPFWNFQVRAAARARTAAPRVAVAGPLISMVARPQLDLGDPPIIRIETAAAARELVERELQEKPDYIKVWYIHRPGDDLAAQVVLVT